MRVILSAALMLALAVGAAPTPGHAQTASRGPVEGRVDRLESEMRAVQRKVFPGGSGQLVQPDNAPATPDTVLPGTPAASPVADLTARFDSLEAQLRAVTGQVEVGQHERELLDARIKVLEEKLAASTPTPTPAPAFGDAPTAVDQSAPSSAGPSTPPSTPAPSSAKGDKPVATKPNAAEKAPADPARAAKLAAIERPESGEAAEDIYLYGYRLWTAKLYPEAEAQFITVTTKYPTHKRASYAQNLLGRSYLEDGKPSLASLAFYDNYKKWPDGDRAPESLYYLAQALVKLDKPAAQVCKVYSELARSYGPKVDADPKMKAGVAKGRVASGCS